MIPQPITIIEPQIRALVDGRLSRLYRPLGRRLERTQPGEVLWVREPFFLPRNFDSLSPSQAALRGGIPNFVADFSQEALQEISPRRRNARELLRAWHRQHLRVLRIRKAHLQNITDAEIEAQGFATGRSGFAQTWNNNLSLAHAGNEWAENPVVLVIDIERIALAYDQATAFGGTSPWAEGEARDPSPPKRCRVQHLVEYNSRNEGMVHG